ncbi:hypothetical protein GCM10023196_079420 [Actinoallomurus vinaceus]|uniref:Uncharacterized protein n=1 Tax=Actinoallomurus vinaceus TaxID=1080074 RepID=A0ABP8UMA7_9ACTN
MVAYRVPMSVPKAMRPASNRVPKITAGVFGVCRSGAHGPCLRSAYGAGLPGVRAVRDGWKQKHPS